jgi:hypothetical protein
MERRADAIPLARTADAQLAEKIKWRQREKSSPRTRAGGSHAEEPFAEIDGERLAVG